MSDTDQSNGTEEHQDDAQQPAEGKVAKTDEGEVAGVVAAEADPHGATVVAAAADDSGAAVVAAEADAHGATVVRAATDESGTTGIIASDVDRHGATVVAAVGDESGVQAVAALETDYFNTLLVAEFANPDAARAAYMRLLEAEIQGVLRIDGVLTVHANDKGEINVDKLTEHSTKTGVKWGAAAGLAIGIFFPPAIIPTMVSWGVAGGVLGKMRNLYHRHQVSKELDGAIGKGNSGIVALIHGVDLRAVTEQIPEATKVTTAEVDEATAKDIAEEAKKADGEAPQG